MHSIRARYSREHEHKDLIKEAALVIDPLFSKQAVEQYSIKEMSRLIREEGLEGMQSDLRKNQRTNQIRTQKRMTNVSCVGLVMILMISVY